MKALVYEAVGLAAGCLTTLSFLPQVIKTFKTRSAKDISLVMYSAFVTGVALWLVYGLMIDSLSIIAANLVTLCLAGAVLIMKLRYK